MKIRSRYGTEVFRIFKSPVTLLVMALILLSPAAGFFFYQPVSASTTAGWALANPALAGGLGGAFLIAMLTLYELNRTQKYVMEPLTDSIISPMQMHIIKILGLLTVGLAGAVITLMVYLPVTLFRLGPVFFMDEYLYAYGIFMFAGFPMGIFAAGAFYQIFRRVDLSFVCFTALALFSMSNWCADLYLMRWINPLVASFSSDFGNISIYRTAAYSRLIWILIFTGLWLLALLCVRVYGKGIWGSVRSNAGKIYLPIAAVLLLGSSVWLFLSQPFVDNAPIETAQGASAGGISYTSMGGQEEVLPVWKVLSNKLSLKLDVNSGSLSGVNLYDIENPSGKEQDCVMNIDPGLIVDQVLVNGTEIPFIDKDEDYGISMKDLSFTLPANKDIQLELVYSGAPQISSSTRRMMMSGKEITPRFISLGGNSLQPKFNASAACPVEGEITLPGDLELISIGKLPEVIRENEDGTKTWKMYSATGRLKFYAGDYQRVKVEGAGFPVYFCYSRAHKKQMEELNIQEIIDDTIAYCSERYGALPFTEEEPLQLVMDSAHFMGGGATENISNMTEYVFSKESMADPLKGAGAAEVIAHEFVHQWWGLGRYVMDIENQTWSSEALTTYTTYRMMKEKYGEDYAKKNYVDVWQDALKDMEQNYYLRNSQYQALLPEKYLFSLQSSVIGRNLYSKAPLQILEAERLIGGEAAMDKVLMKLFENGGTEIPPLVTWQDFLDACGLKEEQLLLAGNNGQEESDHD